LVVQLAVVPVPVPAQVQAQLIPLVVTLDAVPGLQRFAVGAVLDGAPLAVPQAPLMFCGGAVQLFITCMGMFVPVPAAV
jgi:hypothetical protein